MAEALTVVGFVASVIQLINATTRTILYINDVKDASKDRAKLAREVTSLLALLTDLRYRAEAAKSTDPWFANVRSLGEKGGPLEQFEEAIDDLERKLKPDNSWKKFGKPFLWTFDKNEINRIITKIERLKASISLALQNDHFALSQVVRDDVAGIVRGFADQRSRDIVAWISTLNFSTKQNDFFSRRQEGTGGWLLESEPFESWVDGTGKTLWCPGLQKDDQTAANLISSLLQQLVRKSPTISDEIVSLYDYHSKNGTRPTLSEWSNLLQLEVCKFSKVFILIDALDECSESNGTRARFIAEIRKLLPSVHLLLSSRHSSTIEHEFKWVATLEIRASDKDVRRYLECQIKMEYQLMRLVKRFPDLQEDIISTIVEKAKGMSVSRYEVTSKYQFLLAQLHISSLAKKDNCRDVRRALRVLPGELYDTYDEAMQRIWSQDPVKVERAKQVLSWISFAFRPLTVREVQHALAVEPEDTDIDEEALPDEDLLVSVCAGLVTIDRESNIIRLVHYTTQEYFERIRTARFPHAQISIATACLTYISFDAFARGPCLSDKEMENRLQEYALLEYAAQHWGDHARGDPEKSIEILALKFLEHSSKLLCSNQVTHLSRLRQSKYSQRFPKKLTGLHIAASFGMEKVARLLLTRTTDIAAKDDNGRTALHSAARKGHGGVVQLLLEKGADIAAKDDSGWTALHWAASYGHDRVTQLLLENGSDVTTKDVDGCTALSQAAWRGHIVVVELLLKQKDVDINSESRYGKTPLSWAAEGGHGTVVELLLAQRGVEVNARSKDGRTPLSLAAGMGCTAAVTLLLNQQHIEADSRSKNGRTPLSWAAGGGHAAVVELLLGRDDVKADAKSQNGLTPLSWAAWGGYTSVVELLLGGLNVNINSKSNNNRTPLSLAAGSGWAAIVRLFLGLQNIEADSESRNGKTPLMWAAGSGHAAVVELFLSRQDVYVNSKDEKGQTSLHWAAEKGHIAVVELLLSRHDIDADPKSKNGRTPLSLAAGMGHAAVVKMLLNRQHIDANSMSENGRTPLSWAAGNGHATVVRLLLDRQYVHVNYKDENHQTPLHWASEKGHTGVVDLLLNRLDVDADCKDVNGRTPLSLAAERGNIAIVELLLCRPDVDADCGDEICQTPFSWAAECGHTAIMKLLLSRAGVKSDSKTSNGRTALSQAAGRGQVAAVELLLSRPDVVADSRSDNDRTPLSWAASRGHTAVMEVLLSHQDVDMNSKDGDGRTPLCWAALSGHAAVVALLLGRKGIEADSSDSSGRTALDWAAKTGNKAAAELLRNHQP
ncbi:hypothetical protein GP486_005895 [Trichoglossum hirsutum]|uniref:Ankyrin repeat protein n=1 Tax=Trichoglossum hirsutum TaxID=265104 RepID=A0A9P8L8G4_9PEZI|nr:hypothetical protein GP486_005895 [Trichoglossum hirsutum]